MLPPPCFFLATVVGHGGPYRDGSATFTRAAVDCHDGSPRTQQPPHGCLWPNGACRFSQPAMAETPVPGVKKRGSGRSHSTARRGSQCENLEGSPRLTWLLLFTAKSQMRSAPSPLPFHVQKPYLSACDSLSPEDTINAVRGPSSSRLCTVTVSAEGREETWAARVSGPRLLSLCHGEVVPRSRALCSCPASGCALRAWWLSGLAGQSLGRARITMGSGLPPSWAGGEGPPPVPWPLLSNQIFQKLLKHCWQPHLSPSWLGQAGCHGLWVWAPPWGPPVPSSLGGNLGPCAPSSRSSERRDLVTARQSCWCPRAPVQGSPRSEDFRSVSFQKNFF